MMKKILVSCCFLLMGCANSDFPFCCDQTGEKNVPYTTTYDFSNGVGFINVGGDKSFLRIISQADLANLFNAANVSKVPGTGGVGGAVFTLSGSPVSDVVLEATDVLGNKIGELFYNSLGGIPDFSSTAGTSTNGGFTILNLPPGEIYLKAVQGGRGNASITSFLDSVSLLKIPVVPVIPPFVGVAGSVKDYTLSTLIGNAFVSPMGLKGLSVLSSSDGKIRFPLLSSDSFFFMKATASGYLPTYQEFQSDLKSRPVGAVDVTQDIHLVSQSLLMTNLNQTYCANAIDQLQCFGQLGSRGILVGSTRDPDETLRNYPYILLSDDQGNPLNFDSKSRSRIYYHGSYFDSSTGTASSTYFFFDPSGTQVSFLNSNSQIIAFTCVNPLNTCPPPEVGTLDGVFVAYDLPPGTVHISATALEKLEQGFDYFTGKGVAELLPGSVTLKDITMQKMDLGKNSFYRGLSGKVTESDGVSPVGFATIFALGSAGSLTTVDGFGNFNIPMNSNLFLDQTSSTIRVSRPQYIDTYQDVQMDKSSKNLILYSTAVFNQYLSAAGLAAQYDVSKGVLTGIILDKTSGRGAGGVTVEATDLSGNAVGEVRYFDSAGLPTLNQFTSKNGGYIIFNLPPGFIQVRVVSQDDSGNGFTHVYPTGIMVKNLSVNKNPSPTVQVSGSTIDLDGTVKSAVSLSVLGEKTTFLSGGNGSFSHSFPTYSHFMVKATSPQAGGMDTYNSFETISNNISTLNLFAMTAGVLQAQASKDAIALDLTKGIIGGMATTSGFSSTPFPVSGYNSSPMVDIAPQRMTIGLFDEDNEVDIAVTNSVDNTLTILLGGGDGTFRKSAGSPLCMPRGTILLPGQTCPTGAQPIAVRSTDLNGDGIPDLVVVNYGADSITVLLGNKKGNFIPAGPPIPLPAGSRPVAVSIGDFNNDQMTDLIVLNSGTNTFSWIPGNGDGTFSGQIFGYNSGGSVPAAILSRDFNGDGNLDLAIVNSGTSSVSIFLGYGTGAFAPSPNSPIFVGSTPIGIAADDFDSDGIIDLVVANSGSSSLSVLLGKGGGIFSPANISPIPLAVAPRFIAVNDINYDGRPDLVTASSSGISVLTGLGDGTFSSETLYPVGGNPSNLVFADFNDDTFTDVIAYQTSVGTLSFLPGSEFPQANISLAAADLDGNPVGLVRYLDINGDLLPGRGQTDPSGRFLIFNVPPGLKNVHTVQGGSGNRFMTSYSGSATITNLSIIPPNLRQISFSGRTIDAVGDQAVRFVEGVQISVLGTATRVISDPINSTFNFSVDSNNSLLIKLQK